MFLNYLALAITLMGITLVFYGFIYIHDIPYQIAKKNNHPQTHAIHIACWLSLFTLHAMWPLVFLWAVTNPQALPVQLVNRAGGGDLTRRIEALEAQIASMKQVSAPQPDSDGARS
jgi:hypothetical protein